MISVEELIEKTKDYDVISFDVFDTLIIRDVLKPSDVFLYEYGFIGKCLRIAAEMLARKRSKNGEVTLADIYRYLPFDIDRELKFEEKICRANPVFLDFYKQIKDSKTVVAISDMYLSRDTIAYILHKSGYDIDDIFVSCEYGCGKVSGDLFRKYIDVYQTDVSKMIHIGDSKEADYYGAKKIGINSVLIEKHKNSLSYRRVSEKNYELNSFINHGMNDIVDPTEKIGYEVIGPLILKFCQWIHEKKCSYGFERLFFLARDMHFSFDIYRKIYPDDEVSYLCVSRKSLEKAKSDSSKIIEYMKAHRCYGNVAIVDTGWVGNAQVQLEKYAKKIDESTDLGGLYLGTKLAFHVGSRSKRSEGCFFWKIHEQFRCELYPPFFETLIGSNEKQVIDYENGAPIFDSSVDRDRTNLLKRGAEKFICEWENYKGNLLIDKKAAVESCESMFRNPHEKHIELISNLEYEDKKSTKLVCFSRDINYWIHPVRWLNDLQDSGWKGAFFKESSLLIRILFPLYRFVNSIRIFLFNLQEIQRNRG